MSKPSLAVFSCQVIHGRANCKSRHCPWSFPVQRKNASPCQEAFSSSLSAFALCWVRLVPRFLPQCFEAVLSEGKSLRPEPKRRQAALSFFRSKLDSLDSLGGSGSCTVCREAVLATLHVCEQESPKKTVFHQLQTSCHMDSSPTRAPHFTSNTNAHVCVFLQKHSQ